MKSVNVNPTIIQMKTEFRNIIVNRKGINLKNSKIFLLLSFFTIIFICCTSSSYSLNLTIFTYGDDTLQVQISPKVFSDKLYIELNLPEVPDLISITIFSIKGNKVMDRTILKENLKEGTNIFYWTGNDMDAALLPDGLYIVSVVKDGRLSTKKLNSVTKKASSDNTDHMKPGEIDLITLPFIGASESFVVEEKKREVHIDNIDQVKVGMTFAEVDTILHLPEKADLTWSDSKLSGSGFVSTQVNVYIVGSYRLEFKDGILKILAREP